MKIRWKIAGAAIMLVLLSSSIGVLYSAELKNTLISQVLSDTGPRTPAPPRPSVSEPQVADYVRVDKTARTLILYRDGTEIYRINGIKLGDAPRGHKQFEGDERTPEGLYTISYGNPQSGYHLSLHISYPNAEDRAFAEARGRSPGGLIFIHGQRNGYEGPPIPWDWTDGCIAVSNAQMEDLWERIPNGTPIKIRP